MGISEQVYNIFNSEGKLLQLEYGLEALYSSPQIVTLVAENEIVFISKKIPQQTLLAEEHNSIHKIGNNLYINITGQPADTDYVLDRTKILAATKSYELGCDVPVDVFSTVIAEKMQQRIQCSVRRPPAFAVNIGGFENGKPVLYYTDMTAVSYPCFATASGENHMKMQKYLERQYKKGNRRQALYLVIDALLQAIGKDAESSEIQVGVLTSSGMEYPGMSEIDSILQEIGENID